MSALLAHPMPIQVTKTTSSRAATGRRRRAPADSWCCARARRSSSAPQRRGLPPPPRALPKWCGRQCWRAPRRLALGPLAPAAQTPPLQRGRPRATDAPAGRPAVRRAQPPPRLRSIKRRTRTNTRNARTKGYGLASGRALWDEGKRTRPVFVRDEKKRPRWQRTPFLASPFAPALLLRLLLPSPSSFSFFVLRRARRVLNVFPFNASSFLLLLSLPLLLLSPLSFSSSPSPPPPPHPQSRRLLLLLRLLHLPPTVRDVASIAVVAAADRGIARMTICPLENARENPRAKARANGARSLRVVQPFNRGKSQRFRSKSQRGARATLPRRCAAFPRRLKRILLK